MVQSFIDQEGGLLKKLLLALLLIAGLGIAGATTASAAPVSHASHASAAAPRSIDPACYSSAACTWDGENTPQAFPCSPADSYSPITAPVQAVSNACDVRVWEHQDSNGGGLTQCISPGQTFDTTSGSWQSKPGNIQVTSNTSDC